VPDTLNVALTLPECALKVEADADGTARSSKAKTIEAMMPDRRDAMGLDKVNPSLLVGVKSVALTLVTSDVLSFAVNKLQKISVNHVDR
jgi:hypothetical protein